MKKYPSVWITKVLGENQQPVYDISVKMRADMEPTHFTKPTKEEAISFCNDNYGGYNSIKEMI